MPDQDEDREYQIWKRDKAKDAARGRATGTGDQPQVQAPTPGTQNTDQEHENRIAELEKVVKEAGLTSKAIDERANKEDKKEGGLLDGLLDFDFEL